MATPYAAAEIGSADGVHPARTTSSSGIVQSKTSADSQNASKSTVKVDEKLFKNASISIRLPKVPVGPSLTEAVSQAERTTVLRGERVPVLVCIKPPEGDEELQKAYSGVLQRCNVLVRMLEPLDSVARKESGATHRYMTCQSSTEMGLHTSELSLPQDDSNNRDGDAPAHHFFDGASSSAIRCSGVVDGTYVYVCAVVAAIPGTMTGSKLLLTANVVPPEFPVDDVQRGLVQASSLASYSSSLHSSLVAAVQSYSAKLTPGQLPSRSVHKAISIQEPLQIKLRSSVMGRKRFVVAEFYNTHPKYEVRVTSGRLADQHYSATLVTGTLKGQPPFPLVLPPGVRKSAVGYIQSTPRPAGATSANLNAAGNSMESTGGAGPKDGKWRMIFEWTCNNSVVTRMVEAACDTDVVIPDLTATIHTPEDIVMGIPFSVRVTVANQGQTARNDMGVEFYAHDSETADTSLKAVDLMDEDTNSKQARPETTDGQLTVDRSQRTAVATLSGGRLLALDSAASLGSLQPLQSSSVTLRCVAMSEGTLALQGLHVVCEGQRLRLKEPHFVMVRPNATVTAPVGLDK